MTLAKSFSPAAIEVGGTSTMRFTVTNSAAGLDNQANIDLADTMPAGMQAVGGAVAFVNLAGSCTFNGTVPTIAAGATAITLTNYILDIDSGDSCAVDIAVTGTTVGDLVNTVTAPAAGNPTSIDNATDTATLVVYARPTIAKAFSPASIAAGGTSTLTFTLTNTHPTRALTGAAFSDTLAGMSVSGAQTVGGTCAGITPAALANGATNLGFSGITIPAAGSCTVSVVVTGTTPGTWPNTASGVTTAQTPVAGTASPTVNLVVIGTSLAKAFSPATITAGTVSRLTFTIANGAGNPAQPNLAFTETLPAGVVVASPANAATTCTGGSVSAAAGGGTIALSGGSFALGDASCAVGVDVTSAAAGTYNNLPGNISGLSAGLSTAGLSATLTVNAAPALSKAFSPASIAPGTTSVLTFTIANGAGNPAQSGLAFTDAFPGNVVVAATPGVQTNCPAGGAFGAPAFAVTAVAGAGSIAVSGASLDAGVVSCQVRVNVTATAVGSYNNNAANITGLAGGLTAGGVNATLAAVGTSLAKSFSPTVIGRGGVSTMTFVVTNGAGNPAQAGLQFTENLPANVFVAPVPNLVNTCGGTVTATAGAGTIPFTGGSLAAGVASCSFSVDVTSAFVSTYNNPSSRILNATPTMDTSGVNATLEVLENVTVDKAFAPATIPAGATSVLTVTLTNGNSLPLAGVAFTDTYTGVIVNAAVPAGATTCGGSVTATAGGNSVALSGGTVPANGSCTVTVNVTGGTAGAQANSIPVGAVTSTNAGANNAAANATLTVVARPVVAKSYSPAEIGSGGTSTLTITLSNPNPATAITGVAFTDAQPGAVTTVAATAATTCGGTASQAAGSVSLAGGTIPAGGSCTVTVQVTSATVGAHANTIAAGDVTSANAGTNTAAANATLDVLGAPTATKSFAPAAIYPDGTSILTITLTNPNATAVTGVAFADNYPAGIVNNDLPAGPALSNTCGGTATALPSGTSVTLSGGTIPAGGSCTVSLTVTSNQVGAYTNTIAAVTTTNAGTAAAANATFTVVGGIGAAKAFAPAAIASGGASTLTITLTNSNTTTTVTGIAFTDTYPGAIANSGTPAAATTCTGGTVTALPGGPGVALSGASLAPGASCTVTVQVTSATSGIHANNLGNVTAANAPTTTGATANLTVHAAPVLAKSFTPSVIGPGGTSALRLAFTNPAGNTAALTGLSVTDPLGTFNLGVAAPATASFAPAACGTVQSRAAVGAGGFGALTAGHLEIRFDVASLAPGATCQVDVNVTSTTLGAANNTTAAPAATGPVAITGTAASATLTVAQASLAKAFAPAAIDAGGISTLTFTLTNGAGNPAQSGINFTDTLPANVVIAATPNVTSSCPSGTGVVSATAGLGVITVTGATMNAAQASCTVTVDVTSSLAGTYNNTNAANITGAARVTTTGVNATLTVQALPVLTKAFAVANLGLGQATTLTFTVANTAGGSVNRTGLSFTDTLPAGLTIANPPVPATNGQCGTPAFTAVNGTQPFTASAIAVNAGQTCTITLTVTGTTVGAKVNGAAQITAISGMTNAVTNQTLTVSQASLAKAFAPATIDQGGISTLTFTLTNGAGNPAQSGINFTDTLPANVVIAATPNLTSSCPSGTGVVSATAGNGCHHGHGRDDERGAGLVHGHGGRDEQRRRNVRQYRRGQHHRDARESPPPASTRH